MNRRELIPLLGGAVAGAPAILAQGTPSKIEQRGREIVNEAIAALGGEKFLNMQDRRETGRAYSFNNTRISGLARAKISVRYLAPQAGTIAMRERQSFGRKEKDIDEAYTLYLEDGKVWDVTFRGAKEMDAELGERYRLSTLHNVLYIFRQRMKEKGLIIEHRGGDVIDYKPVDIVDITDSENRVTTVHFHRSTKLPVKQMFKRRNTAKLQDEEVTVFDKYLDVNGVLWPRVVQRYRNGDKVFEMFAEKVEINIGLLDNIFSLPSNVEIL
jgi:hypothetical protein